jgi:hypothetical protein
MFAWSRYRYCTQYTDSDGKLFIDEREPFRYREETDNRFHRARLGDTWWGLAHIYFQGIPRPCGLWWLLCEYQPDPVIDPTIVIPENKMVIIPSMRVLRMMVFTPERRRFH